MQMIIELAQETNSTLYRFMACKALSASELRLQTKLSVLFAKAEAEIIREFKSVNRIPGDIVSQRSMLDAFTRNIPEYQKVISDESVFAAGVGRRSALMDIKNAGYTFNFLDKVPMPDNIAKLIRDKTFVASSQTMNRIFGNVMGSLTKSYEAGLGIDDAARELKEVFSSIRGYEAVRIARTEIQSSQNEGAFETQREMGVKFHQWWSGEDSRVRDGTQSPANHVFMHGQIVRVGEPFSNGLQFPGDMDGSIDEWINCRCRTVPYLMPFGFMAPPGMDYFYEADLVKNGGIQAEEG